MISGVAYSEHKEYTVTTICICIDSDRYETEIKSHAKNRYQILDGFMKISGNQEEADLAHKNAEMIVRLIENRSIL